MKIKKYEDRIIFEGTEKGPKSAVFVGVHGNEIGGVLALEGLLKNFVIDYGSVTFVYGNPRAIKMNTRFVEFNLNRAFKKENEYSDEIKNTYEYKRAQILKKYLTDVDVLIDVHSSSNIKSEPFIICERNAKEIIKFFPKKFKKVLYGFDAIQPGGTDWYMNSLGKIGICAECGFHEDPKVTVTAKETIVRFLESRGHFKRGVPKTKIYERQCIQMKSLYNTKSDNFVITKNFADFEKLKKGDIIGIDDKIEIIADNNVVILFAQNRNKKGAEAFLLGEVINN